MVCTFSTSRLCCFVACSKVNLLSSLRSQPLRALPRWSRAIASLNAADVQLNSYEQSMLWKSEDDETRCAMSYSLAFGNSAPLAGSDGLSDTMKQQLAYSQKNSVYQLQQQHPLSYQYAAHVRAAVVPLPDAAAAAAALPLPRTLADAFRVKSRAVVVTEAIKPFCIADVNASWERLCGYTYCESKGKTLGSLLKGPDTDPVSATALITKLLHGEDEAGTTLVNYTKQGRRFVNRIRVGPLKDERGAVTHFVGVLQEIGQ